LDKHFSRCWRRSRPNVEQGSYASWKVLDFCWKILESHAFFEWFKCKTSSNSVAPSVCYYCLLKYSVECQCHFFFLFKHLWSPNRSWKIIHGCPGKSWKSPVFFVSRRVGTLVEFVFMKELILPYQCACHIASWFFRLKHSQLSMFNDTQQGVSFEHMLMKLSLTRFNNHFEVECCSLWEHLDEWCMYGGSWQRIWLWNRNFFSGIVTAGMAQSWKKSWCFFKYKNQVLWFK